MIREDQLLADLADRIHNRFYGKYRGVVTQVDGSTMRLRAKVPSVLLDQETGWAMPCVPYAGPHVGVAFLPEPGSGVWIEFEGGDVSFPVWTGCYWRKNEIPPEATAQSKAIVTKKSKVVFDDAAPRSTWSDVNENTVRLDSDGIVCERGAKAVKVTTESVSVNDGALKVT